jgi:glycosyltransferase involved in cell wall biosynthesis
MEPLGQSQILPYLTGLAGFGHSLHIISFEKPDLLNDSDRVASQRERLEPLNICWLPRPYRRGASLRHLLIDVLATSREIRNTCAKVGIDILHCRAHVPGWMALSACNGLGIPMLFDFRGFLAEEYADAGLWRRSSLKFKAAKLLERRLIRRCSAMVVLTETIREYFQTQLQVSCAKMFVIPCCVDLSRFHPSNNLPPPADGRVRVVYAGSTGGRYPLSSMLDFYRLILERCPGSELTILSSNNPVEVESIVARCGLPRDLISCYSASPSQVPAILARSDIGLAFNTGDLALMASSPTKIGEYLASGLAVVADEKIGGLRRILVDEAVGCLVASNNPATWPQSIETILGICSRPNYRQRCFDSARKFYDLSRGIADYARAYECCAGSAAAEASRRRG